MTGHAFAHRGVIKGYLYSQSTNAPLVNASVELLNTGKVTQTDKFGFYAFKNLEEGLYQLRFSYLGFKSLTTTVQVSETEIADAAPVVTSLPEGDINLAEVSVSAYRPEPLQTISTLDINLRPIQSTQDVLRIVPGLFIAQHAGGGKAEQLFLRGFDIDHGTDIRLTVDGIPVNMVSHAHGQGYADLHFVIPETIEEVSFGKGPYQASQGNFATAGYADFKTRSQLDKNSIKLEAGLFNTYRAVGMVNLLGQRAKKQNQHAYLASEFLFSNGYFESPQDLNRLNVLGKYQGGIGKNSILTAVVSTFRSSWNASGQVPDRAVAAGIISRFGAIDDTEGGETSRHNITASILNILPNQAVLENQLYFVNYNFELYSNFTFFLYDPENGDQIRQKEYRNIYGYQSTYSTDKNWLGKTSKSEAGVGMRYDVVDDSELSRTKDRNLTLVPVKKGGIRELNLSAYLSETLELSPKFTVKGALRFDQFFFRYNSQLPNERNAKQEAARYSISPKFNLFYTSSPMLQLYLSTGMGFHSNDTRVSVKGKGEKVLPKAYGVDLGMLYKPVDKLILNAALWALDLEQELVYVGDEGIVEPSGKTRRIGLDIAARYQFNKYFFADADINLIKPRYREHAEGNNYIPLAPTMTSTGGLTYNGTNNFSGSIRYRYLHDRAANEDYSLTADGYMLLDAVLSYTLKKLEFKLTVENLMNVDWKEAQFETESKLRNEAEPVSEIHFTPGTPFFVKLGVMYKM